MFRRIGVAGNEKPGEHDPVPATARQIHIRQSAKKMSLHSHKSDRHSGTSAALRLDKWLWVARFFKTRSLAQQAIEAGQVRVNGKTVKPAREARVGDLLDITHSGAYFQCSIRALCDRRGPASVAQALFEETAASLSRRKALREGALLPDETQPPGGERPTKRIRRKLDRWRQVPSDLD